MCNNSGFLPWNLDYRIFEVVYEYGAPALWLHPLKDELELQTSEDALSHLRSSGI